MSGGRFDYKQFDIDRLLNSIESTLRGQEDEEFENEVIEINSKEVKEKLEEAFIILKAAFIYIHRIDWLLSGDDNEQAFFKRLVQNFSEERINLSIDRVNGKTIIQLSKNNMTNLNLKELAREIHENAKAKGFYDNKDHKFFKHAQVFEIIKEVAEFHEAYKKGKDGEGDWYLENPKEVGASAVFTACIKDTWQDELADIMIRLLDYAAFVGFEFPKFNAFLKNSFSDHYEFGSTCLDFVAKLADISEEFNWQITESIYYVLDFANSLNCNLDWHILAKMEYNKKRERLHGKRF